MSSIARMRILITGASAGIGEACARRLADEGADLVLWARRLERLESLSRDLEENDNVDVEVAAVDVRDRDAVSRAAAAVLTNGAPDVLINNAGLASGLATIQEGDPDDWDRMIDTNIKGLLHVTRAFLPAMIERDHGHVVNIGSISGRDVYRKGNVYNATKFAVRALNQALLLDVKGTLLRVSSVDPGAVETEFSVVRFGGDGQRADSIYQGFEPLAPADVADAVSWVISRPPNVNIADLTILPTAQRSGTVIHRDDGSS